MTISLLILFHLSIVLSSSINTLSLCCGPPLHVLHLSVRFCAAGNLKDFLQISKHILLFVYPCPPETNACAHTQAYVWIYLLTPSAIPPWPLIQGKWCRRLLEVLPFRFVWNRCKWGQLWIWNVVDSYLTRGRGALSAWLRRACLWCGRRGPAAISFSSIDIWIYIYKYKSI